MTQPPLERSSNWLCLDCGKDTFENNDDYYMLRNRLWRQLVPREQRSGNLLCHHQVSQMTSHPRSSSEVSTRSRPRGAFAIGRPGE